MPMTSLHQKSAQATTASSNVTNLLDRLYELRKSFESEYSGALRCSKYEATRDFTINLNHTIFEANQISYEETPAESKTKMLENKLKQLNHDLKMLFL